MMVQKLTKAEAGRLGAAKTNIISAAKKSARIAEYNKNPAKCKACNCPLSYEDNQRKKKFCNSSCAAIYNNTKFPKRAHGKTYDCLFCEKENKWSHQGTNKYCNNDCFQASRRDKRDVLVETGTASAGQCKAYLIERNGAKCQKCDWAEINPITGNVPIDLEHIDGDSNNNVLLNLELLCPNCHSLTPTYKALNKGNGRHARRERYAAGKSF